MGKESKSQPKEGIVEKLVKLVPPLSALTDLAAGTSGGISVGTGIFLAFISTPYQRRMLSWLEGLGERLDRLEKEINVDFEKLSKDDSFIDKVMYATQIAMRNHSEEKREALRNVILNSALPNPPEEAIQQMFLNFIDLFTEWHLRILKLVDNPEKWDEEHGKELPIQLKNGIVDIIYNAYKELENRGRLCWLI